MSLSLLESEREKRDGCEMDKLMGVAHQLIHFYLLLLHVLARPGTSRKSH
jgi:hypothetical protein